MNCWCFRAGDEPEPGIRDRDEQPIAMTWHASKELGAGNLAASGDADRANLKDVPANILATIILKDCVEK
jgi:hypothetical protein